MIMPREGSNHDLPEHWPPDTDLMAPTGLFGSPALAPMEPVNVSAAQRRFSCCSQPLNVYIRLSRTLPSGPMVISILDGHVAPGLTGRAGRSRPWLIICLKYSSLNIAAIGFERPAEAPEIFSVNSFIPSMRSTLLLASSRSVS